jgi:hypothetical protein
MIIDQINEDKKHALYLIGIQPENVRLGTEISSKVIESANELIEQISISYYSKII